MTPEERAAKIVDDIECDADFYCDGRVSGEAADKARKEARDAIAAAIRGAENDALERAAEWHDQKNMEFKDKLYRDHTKFAASGGKWNWHHEEFAFAIRALKHPTSS